MPANESLKQNNLPQTVPSPQLSGGADAPVREPESASVAASPDESLTSAASSTDPWSVAERENPQGFVFVTRPLETIRLADAWLDREGLRRGRSTSQHAIDSATTPNRGQEQQKAKTDGTVARQESSTNEREKTLSPIERKKSCGGGRASQTDSFSEIDEEENESSFDEMHGEEGDEETANANNKEVFVTQIRRKIYNDVDAKIKNGKKRGKKGRRGASKQASPFIFGGDEHTMEINQQSFLRDMLRAFTAKSTNKPLGSALSVTGSFVGIPPPSDTASAAVSPSLSPFHDDFTSGGQCEADASRAISQYCANTTSSSTSTSPFAAKSSGAGGDNSNGKNNNNGNTAPPAITEDQWRKIWQQFKNDIGRELFCIEGTRFTDADEALVSLRLLFRRFEDEWARYQSAYATHQEQAAAASRGGSTSTAAASRASPSSLAALSALLLFGGAAGGNGNGNAAGTANSPSGTLWRGLTSSWPASLAVGLVTAPLRLLSAGGRARSGEGLESAADRAQYEQTSGQREDEGRSPLLVADRPENRERGSAEESVRATNDDNNNNNVHNGAEENGSAAAINSNNNTPHPSSSSSDAIVDAYSPLVEGLARFVVLLSQQSVLAFPFELLHGQFATGVEDIYVGEIRTIACSSAEEEELEEEARADGGRSREAAEMATSMRVDVTYRPMTTREVEEPQQVSRAASNSNARPSGPVAVPVPIPATSRAGQSTADGCPSSEAPMGGPIPDSRNIPAAGFDSRPQQGQQPSQRPQPQPSGSSNQPSLVTTRTTVTAPSVTLTVKKEFRVFAIKDTEDCTLFHIEAILSLEVTKSGEPVLLSWVLKPAPRRPDRVRQSKLTDRGLRAAREAARGTMPSYAAEARSPSQTGGISLASPQDTPIDSLAIGTETHQQIDAQQVATPAARTARQCACLGASAGYHRPQCEIGQAPAATNSTQRGADLNERAREAGIRGAAGRR